jgi:sugar phosphate isomerase/epimerase
MLLTSLPLDFEPALRQAVVLGFGHVDVVSVADRPQAHLAALADSGLLVACAAVGKGLPEGLTLDAVAVDSRRGAGDEVKRQLTDAARLGATHAYLVPGKDATAPGLGRFTDACVLLAEYAAGRMVRLCVEHVPGRSLPTAAAALDWLARTGHPNLALLLDVGHCLISGEDPAHAILQAGPRLGYVHVDDNDGVNDLHWPLLAGRLTEERLTAVVAALGTTGYAGALSLELNPQHPEPVENLRRGKTLLASLIAKGRAAGDRC